MKLKSWSLLLSYFLFITCCYAEIGPSYVVGEISNITSIDNGILVRIGENETPDNCTSSNVWMEIAQQKTAMTSLILTTWALGRSVVIYTAPSSSGYCQVTQVDPNEV